MYCALHKLITVDKPLLLTQFVDRTVAFGNDDVNNDVIIIRKQKYHNYLRKQRKITPYMLVKCEKCKHTVLYAFISR